MNFFLRRWIGIGPFRTPGPDARSVLDYLPDVRSPAALLEPVINALLSLGRLFLGRLDFHTRVFADFR